MKKLILTLIIIAGLIEGCKKYEDGPLISLRSAKNRLYGEYMLTEYTVNGADSLSLFNDSLCLNFDFFFEDVNSYDVCFIVGYRKDGHYSELYWRWHLIDNNKVLQIYRSVGISVGTGPFGTDKLPEWDILRLTNNEVKLKTQYNGKEYIIVLN